MLVPQDSPSSQQSRDDSLAALDLLGPEPLLVPLATVDGPGEHGDELVEQEQKGRGAGPPAGHPVAEPLAPLEEVVRVEDELEEAGLGDGVVALDRLGPHALVPGHALAPALLPPPDLAELVVVVVVCRQAQVEDADAHDELQRAAGAQLGAPLLLRGRPVGCQPGPQARAVHDLEEDGRGGDDDVHGRHGGRHQRVHDGAVAVVDRKQAGQHLVLPGEVVDAVLGRQRAHVVEQYRDPRDLHQEPGETARDVKDARVRGFTHRVPRSQPLYRWELGIERKCQ